MPGKSLTLILTLRHAMTFAVTCFAIVGVDLVVTYCRYSGAERGK